jgi:hypothetical protein
MDVRWIYTRSIVMDGNFSAEHMKMRRSEDDVKLTDGTGFMVESTHYREHISVANDIRQVCDILFQENHR